MKQFSSNDDEVEVDVDELCRSLIGEVANGSIDSNGKLFDSIDVFVCFIELAAAIGVVDNAVDMIRDKTNDS